MNELQKANILLVDDRPENLLALENLLDDLNVNIFKATSGNGALGMVLDHEFALVLLDVQMPDMDGFEAAELMRGSERTRHVPIIFVTAISKEQKHIFKGYDAGAVDYIFKPLDPHILRAKVKVFLELQMEKTALKRTTIDLKQTIKELERAKEVILEQQKSVVEEERLKVLLQMAGATAHELGQPLTVLLGNIDLMALNINNPEKLTKRMSKIKEAGRRISKIVKKIHNIRHDEIRPYTNESFIINFDQKVSVLSVEDSDEDFLAISNIMKEHGNVKLSHAKTIAEAVNQLEQNRIDLIFLDYLLPDGNGFDFLDLMEKKGKQIPVAVITGQGDEVVSSQLIQAGAYEYLSKERVNDKSLLRIITNTLEKDRLKREVKEAYEKIARMSTEDELTGLNNRRFFMEALELEVSRANRYGTGLTLCLLDLDHSKRIHEVYGHSSRDRALMRVGKLLNDYTRKSDVKCRYGAAEFAVMMPNTDIDKALAMIENFREKVAEQVLEFDSEQVPISVSAGITPPVDSGNISAEKLIEQAGKALYQAKETGRNKVVLYPAAL